MSKKDVKNLLVNTKIRSIHFVNIVMLCECTYVWLVCFYTAFCLYVCIFFLRATILVNKDVYIKVGTPIRHEMPKAVIGLRSNTRKWSSNMADVCFSKPEVDIYQPWIDMSTIFDL